MKTIMTSLFVVLCVFLVACQGNDENMDLTTPAPNNDDTTPQSDYKTDETENTPQTVTGDSGLRDALQAQGTLEYSVTYDAHTDSNGQSYDSTMTQYLKGLNKLRMDVAAQGMESRTYVLSGDITSCFKQGGNWMCRTMEGDGDAAIPQAPSADDLSMYKIENLPSRKIAGVNTDCYKMTVDESVMTYCFSPEHVPLYIHIIATEDDYTVTNELTATEYDTEVAESVFTVPETSGSNQYPGGFNPSDYT